MPLIEELPTNATVRPSHGWTYVADSGTGTPLPTAPLKSRKRGRDAGAAITTQAAQRLSAKQEKAIQQRLNDLAKENHRDVHIPILKREGGRVGKERKTTQNVRRILAYSRTFQHYLADEEAGANVYGSAGVVTATSTSATHSGQASGGRTDSKKKGTVNESSKTAQKKSQPPAPKRAGSLKQTAPGQVPSTLVKKEKSETGEDVRTSQAPASSSSPTLVSKSPTSSMHKSPQQKQSQQQSSPSTTTLAPNSQPPYDPALDHDPLLKTLDLPRMPSERLMATLLAEPPLSYTAARAKPLDDTSSTRGGSNILLAKPPRYFCAICGYWGKVKCKRGCGERVCGIMECWKAHAGVCTISAY
ncbi:hypothetical protein LTR84_012099 [Exophiala bonariae]|uniref:HIT-type domain-containing protein n=1 Tax=Exophiala bonariae TaxID=1690606 RepID=A0AAV9NIY8_9EURO|nr:hypothetical protein LTR84_012099 [Exophiala bonariae]